MLSALVAGIFTAPRSCRANRSLLVFAVLFFGFTVLAQQTPGMRLLGLRVVRVDRAAPIGLWRSVVRTVGVILLVPGAAPGRATAAACTTAPDRSRPPLIRA